MKSFAYYTQTVRKKPLPRRVLPMITRLFVLLCINLLALASFSFSQSNDCMLVPPDSLRTPYSVRVDSMTSPLWQRENVYIFRPDTAGRFPVVFFCHTYGANDPREYKGMLEHMAGMGHVVIFSPVRRISFTRKQIFKYDMLYIGFDEAVRKYKSVIDTTRTAYVGHGYGAGAIPWLSRKNIIQNRWGLKGTFLYLLSPWYVYSIDQREMQDFPAEVKVFVEVFRDDRTNDPRIAYDIYKNMGVRPEHKAFCVLFGDARGRCRLRADHGVPLDRESFAGETNALDYYGVYKIFDALSADVFLGDTVRTLPFFAHAGARSIPMGQWADGIPVHPAVVSDSPFVYLPKGFYFNEWNGIRNPRIESSRFKKARKMYVRYYLDKIRLLVQKGGQLVRTRVADTTDLETMENPIINGYGSEGKYDVVKDSFPSPHFPALHVYSYLPKDNGTPVPVVFFIPGYSGPDPELFGPLLRHIASKGYAVLYSPYPIIPVANSEKIVMEKHNGIEAGFEMAVNRYRARLDTTKVGYMAQSFGAGVAPYIAWKGLVEQKRGSAGAFLFLMAPWYSFGVSDEMLKQYPAHTKIIIQVYDDDAMNDHQMAVDLFNHIGIPNEEKDYITVYTDSSQGIVMHANHFVPYGTKNPYGEENLLDYYAVYRLFDALADYSFNGNLAGKKVALGNGSPEQVTMGEWPNGTPVKPLTVTDHPKAGHPELSYVFMWDNSLNPRRNEK
jgi:hypothetical protein